MPTPRTVTQDPICGRWGYERVTGVAPSATPVSLDWFKLIGSRSHSLTADDPLNSIRSKSTMALMALEAFRTSGVPDGPGGA